MTPRRLRVGLLLLLTAGASEVNANPVSVGSSVAWKFGGLPPKVQAQVAQGQAALTEKRYADALQVLSNAYRQAPRAGLLLLLARVAAGEGRTLDSTDLYRRYLADPTREPDEEATREAEKAVLAEPPEAGSIIVQGDNGMLVWVDGLLRGSVPLAQPVLLAPGKHTVRMELGASKREQVLTVQHGRLLELRTNQRAGSMLISKLPALLVLGEWGKVPPEAMLLLREAQERAARQQTMALMPAAAAIASLPTVKDCLQTAPCQQQLLQKNELEYVLRSQVQYESGPSRAQVPAGASGANSSGAVSTPGRGRYRMKLSLLHAELQQPASEHESSCEACTPEAASAQYLAALNTVLGTGLARKRGVLALGSEPVGAQVYLDKALLGVTPLTRPMWAGQYELALKQAGYEELRHTVQVDVSTPPEKVTLKEIPEPRPATLVRQVTAPRPRWRLVAGGVSLGMGALLLGAGAGLVSINGQCVADTNIDGTPQSPQGPGLVCPDIYKTTAPGSGLIGVAIAGVLTGTVLLAIPGEKRVLRE